MEGHIKYKVNVDLIEKFREEKGLTKLEFCKLCNILPSFYAKLTYNNVVIGDINIFKIANFMGVPILDLIKTN